MLEQIKIGGNTMNAKKQLLTSVLCASLILASFAGCSGKENPGSAPDSSAGVSASSDMGTASQGGEENRRSDEKDRRLCRAALESLSDCRVCAAPAYHADVRNFLRLCSFFGACQRCNRNLLHI